MKKLILVLSLITLVSCSTNDDPGDVNTSIFKNIITLLPQGNWEVTAYIDNETDKTADFESYIFTFNEDGSVIGKNDLFSETGTWEYQNSANSSGSNEEKLVLQFGQTAPFDEISNDWKIITANSAKVELKDNSGNNDDILTFSKL